MWQKILMTPVGNVDRVSNAYYAVRLLEKRRTYSLYIKYMFSYLSQSWEVP